MGIELKKGENVFYPAPYVPSEPALLIVTDQRIVYFGDDGRQEMESKKVSFVGRLSGRPYLWLCVVLALIGAPLFLYAGNEWFGLIGDTPAVKDMKNFSDQTITEDTGAEDPLITKIKVLAMAAVGAGLCFAAFKLVKKKRWIVVVRGGDELLRLRVPDEMKQTQVVMTIQAMVQTAKAMKDAAAKAAAATAAAKKS
jgi:hypothetical protein